jgi:molybdopterin converting factor small subunit
LLVAVDQMMAKADTMVSESSEVAFFPPVTGG